MSSVALWIALVGVFLDQPLDDGDERGRCLRARLRRGIRRRAYGSPTSIS